MNSLSISIKKQHADIATSTQLYSKDIKDSSNNATCSEAVSNNSHPASPMAVIERVKDIEVCSRSKNESQYLTISTENARDTILHSCQPNTTEASEEGCETIASVVSEGTCTDEKTKPMVEAIDTKSCKQVPEVETTSPPPPPAAVENTDVIDDCDDEYIDVDCTDDEDDTASVSSGTSTSSVGKRGKVKY